MHCISWKNWVFLSHTDLIEYYQYAEEKIDPKDIENDNDTIAATIRVGDSCDFAGFSCTSTQKIEKTSPAIYDVTAYKWN